MQKHYKCALFNMHGKLMFMGFLTKVIDLGLQKLTSSSLTPTSSNFVLSGTLKVHFLDYIQ